MTDTTKESNSGQVKVDTSRFEKANLVRALAKDISSKGYAVADGSSVRVYNTEDFSNFDYRGGSVFMNVLKDRSSLSRNIATSGIPVLRLLRRPAEVVAKLALSGNDIKIWDMTVHGEENLGDMQRLANELALNHKISIKLSAEPTKDREKLVHPASSD